ncbi:heterokaryon incompatibility protein-domain-containing protein [Dactylonectria estremocensis]|uniref:Heterokaryon incompatibility protein-domain-containing protein n=1 Tax=Dactylonectria estremocensis TaxID=1079267 RepID=A0A9P9EHD5_9HYPO|nr:heterokaryon incompatibility protein-domain-containing protein [Dactylonectria estremocensis]
MENTAPEARAELPAAANSTRGCPVCRNLQPSVERYESKTIEVGSLRDECEYCQLLKSALAHLSHGRATNVFMRSSKREPIRITYHHDGDPDGRDTPIEMAELILYSHDDSQLIPELGTLNPYPRSTDLDASIDFIGEQLEKCLTQHKTCRRRHESPLPTRVLSIGSSDSDVRLVELKNVRARYVTLSHCWGDKQPARTTGSNLADMKKSINFTALPIVFQQAISVVRMLKIDYIWIDSLCIIQDSQSDWELESVQMCDYYENSFLTISTAASSDPTIPFLGPRDETWWPVKLELVTPRAREYVYAQRLAKTSEEEGKLFTRAWAWQEAAISTRTIYFTPSELIWECLKQVSPQRYIPDLAASDRLGFSKVLSSLRFNMLPSNFDPAVYPEAHNLLDNDSDTSSSSDISISAPSPRFVSEVSRPCSSGSSSGSSSSDTDMMNYIWDMWDDLVAYYSRRQLTFATDKLPALSGVASRVHKVTQSRYLAGMWEENLALNLCWTRVDIGAQDLMSLPMAYVAPSWSWASIPGGVEAEVERTIESFEPGFAIIEAYCHVPGLNPFGKVSVGHLVLRGQVAEVMLTCDNPQRSTSYELSGPLEKWNFSPDSALKMSSGDVSRARGGQGLSKFRARVLCLYIGASYGTSEGKELNRREYFMMVLGNSGDNNGSFCRVGLASSKRNLLFKDAPELEIKLM